VTKKQIIKVEAPTAESSTSTSCAVRRRYQCSASSARGNSMSTEVANSSAGKTLPTFDPIHWGFIDPPSLTPYRIIYQGGKASVRHYKAAGPLRQIPIVLVYALIKRPFVLDLEPGRSVVEDLTRQGFEVFLIDWLPPNAGDSWRGFDAYVNQDLAHAIHAVRVHQGVEQVTVLGYCLGALLSVIYASLHPQHVRNLVTLSLPLDTSVRELPAYQLTDWLDESMVAFVTAAYGNCPAWLLQNVFAGLSATYRFGQYFGLCQESERDRYAKLSPAFRDWLASDVPLAGRLFRELVVDVFKKNLLARGQMTVGGEVVNLGQIAASLLNVIAEADVIVHPKSSLPLVDLVGSADRTNLVFPTGHIGVAVSTEAHAKLWPQIGNWLAQRDNAESRASMDPN
jgi:polyhydroxyalkanoate synthase subunit PhaC